MQFDGRRCSRRRSIFLASNAYVENAPIIKANFTRFSLVVPMKQYYLVISIVFQFRWLMITYAMTTWMVFDQCGNIISSAIEIIFVLFSRKNIPHISDMSGIRAFRQHIGV